MKNQKLKEVLGSRNFLASLITMALLMLKGFGVEDLPIESGEEMYDNMAELIMLLSAWIITPIITAIKKISEKSFDASYFTNSNFITAVLTVVGGVATVYMGEQLWGTISLVVINLLNVIFQVTKPAKASTILEKLPKTPKVTPKKK